MYLKAKLIPCLRGGDWRQRSVKLKLSKTKKQINLGATSTAAVTARCSATATETRGNDTTPAATWTPDGCAVGLVEPWRLK
jgi:hypothetical protein